MAELTNDYWEKRWKDGRTGWHQAEVTPLLKRFWPSVGLQGDEKVLVPFCGKSLDMIWLAQQGHSVLGVELSGLAIQQFFAENGLQASREQAADGVHYVSDRIEIIQGDIFQVESAALADCQAVYDRAAMIALPEAQRAQYQKTVYGRLPPDCRGLLLTIEYPAHEKDGPPFPVTVDEVSAQLANWQITLLERDAIIDRNPGFREEGVTALYANSFTLRKLRRIPLHNNPC